MKALWLIAGLVLLGAGGCSRPSGDECRKAALNLQRLRGLDTNPQAPDPESAVRKCQATGNRKVVLCIMGAKTIGEAEACQKQ